VANFIPPPKRACHAVALAEAGHFTIVFPSFSDGCPRITNLSRRSQAKADH
jgi:hypothetical protein